MQNFDRIRDIVHEITGIPSELITAESTAAQLRADSLDMTEIIMMVEDEFDILIENEDSIRSVNDLVNCVEAQVA
ncbi:MAG: acyl carrier protein [Clostridia bacterium]